MKRLARLVPRIARRRLEVFLIDHGWPPARSVGPAGIQRLGHRGYVGAAGRFDAMGRLQFEFMLQRGLRPGNYLGLEGEQELLDRGVREELDPELLRTKRPELIASYSFEFDRFSRSPRFALAVSLFSHLNEADIRCCLSNLAMRVTGPCDLFASFFESDRPLPNFQRSHSHLGFYYTREQMERFGSEAGWTPRYLGEWGSPAGQMMMQFSIGR